MKVKFHAFSIKTEYEFYTKTNYILSSVASANYFVAKFHFYINANITNNYQL